MHLRDAKPTATNGHANGIAASAPTAALMNGVKANGTASASAAIAAAIATPAEVFSIVQIGCGVVGHAYAQAFVNAGHVVYGVEASRARMAELSDSYPMHHISEDLSTLRNLDFILLSINTPLDSATGALNMRYIWSSMGNVCAMLSTNSDALVVVRSTVTIGFCAAYRSALEERVGHAVRLCFQPEFLRAKSALEDATRPWQVVLGCKSPAVVADYHRFQRQFICEDKIVHCSIDEAEIMKIFHNSFNAMKISFFNQANLLIEQIKRAEGKDIDAAKTFKIIGRTCEGLLNPQYGLTPGHAYYGTCLPKDSAELAHMEDSYGLQCNLFRSVVEVNDVVRATDKEEVLHGDNHARNEAFHARLPTGAIAALHVKEANGGKEGQVSKTPMVVKLEAASGDGLLGAEDIKQKSNKAESPSAVQEGWQELHTLKQEPLRS